ALVQRGMPLSLLWPAGSVLQLLCLAKLHGSGGRTLHFTASGAAPGRPYVHHVSAALSARIHVHPPPLVPPVLQRRSRPEPHVRPLLAQSVPLAVMANSEYRPGTRAKHSSEP